MADPPVEPPQQEEWPTPPWQQPLPTEPGEIPWGQPIPEAPEPPPPTPFELLQRFVKRLYDYNVVTFREMSVASEAQGIPAEQMTMAQVVRIAAGLGASPESLMEAAKGIPGAVEAVSTVFASSRRSSATRVQAMVALEDAQVPGTVYTMFGQGVVHLAISRQEARNRGIAEADSGDEVEIIYTDAEGQSAPMTLRVFFSDDSTTKVTQALRESGMGWVADGEDFASIVAGLGEIGDFYGGQDRKPVRRPVPTWVDPSGFLEVPPTFRKTGGDGPTGDDAWDYVDGWSLEAIADLQERMQASRLGTRLAADGRWTPEWASEFADVLARANEMGTVLPYTTYGGLSPQEAGRDRQLERLEGMARGTMGRAEADDRVALGIQSTLDEFAARPMPRLQELNALVQPLRVRQSPEEMNEMLQAAARSVSGRRLDDYQLAQFATFLKDRVRLVEQQEDFVARRDYYASQIAEAGGTLQDPGFELTPAQRRALETQEITLVKDPAQALNEYMKKVFAADLAAQARRAEFAGAGDRLRGAQRSVLSTIATVRRAGG